MGGFTLSPLYYRYILYPLGGTTFLLPLISSRNVGSNPQDAKNATHICTCGTVQAGYATLSDSRPLAQMVQRTRWAHFLWVLAGLSPLNGPDDHANDAFCFKPGIQSTRAGYFQFKLGDEESPPIRLPTLMNVIPKSKGFEDDREGRYGFKLVISDAQGRLNVPLFSQDRGSLLPR
jgi:hypothetical protein